MALDFKIKTSVDEETHDNALVVSRAYGFKTRAEWARFLIERELRGFEFRAALTDMDHVERNRILQCIDMRNKSI